MKKIGKKNIGLLIIIIFFGIYSVPKIIDRLSNENVIDTNRLHQKEELSFLKIDGKDRKVPDFVLTNQDSLFISNDDLLGKVYVLEFFFSRCPDICIEMNKNMKKPLGPISFIKKEHKKGAGIALNPNISCKPAPAETNFSLGKKSFT